MDVLKQLLARLVPFCREPGSLQAFQPHFPSRSYPSTRWSCSHGPYQTKVAAAILSANSFSPLPHPLHETANSVYSYWRCHSLSNTLDGTHPAFYHLEGLALAAANGWDSEALAVAENAFLQIMGMRKPVALMAPYFNGSALLNRSDVLAQALRMGCILRSKASRVNVDLDRKIKHLADVLGQFADESGAMQFSQCEHFRHKNVWASMFAHQALYFYEVVASGEPLNDRWLKLLV